MADTDLGELPVFSKIDLQLSDWKDGIAVRSPNWLGDAVMSIPAMLQIRRMMPGSCGFFVVIPPSLYCFFKTLPFVDDILQLSAAHKLWKKDEIIHLEKLHAGIGLLFNNSLRDTIYFRLAKISKLFGASARGRDLLLTRSFKFPGIKKGQLNMLHHAGRCLSMAYALGANKWDGEFPEFDIAKDPELMSKEFLELCESENLLAVAPGAAYGESKRWPAENFRKVCGYWIEKGGKVAILGRKGEENVADEAAWNLPKDAVSNLVGKTDLAELMLILKRARVCMANDSGIMHLSAALGGRGVAIFGSTDPSLTFPLSHKWTVLFEKQECAPCFSRKCRLRNYKCLQAISVSSAIEAIERTLIRWN